MFQYFMPVELHFGKDCLRKKGMVIRNIGKKALIVTGASSAKKSGALGVVEEVSAKLSISSVLYSQIKENPSLESIYEGAEKFTENDCDFLIGIGGGSPIDAAKAISVVAANNLKGEEIYNPHNIASVYPIIAVPTTSGTGTEATPYSVITSGDKKAGFGSPKTFPKISFLDPAFTMTMPEKVTRDTAIDALSHLLEGLYSSKRCPLVYPMIMSGIRIIYTTLDKVLQEPDNYELRKQLMIASLYGGIVISQTSTTLQHSIGYPLTTKYGLSHGLANGIVMKHIMNLYYPYVENELDMVFTHLNCTKEEFFKWLDKLGFNISLNLESDYIAEAAKQIYKSRNMALNPLKVEVEEIEKILSRL